MRITRNPEIWRAVCSTGFVVILSLLARKYPIVLMAMTATGIIFVAHKIADKVIVDDVSKLID